MRIRVVQPERPSADPRRLVFRVEWDGEAWAVVREFVGERTAMLNGFGQLVARLGIADRPEVVDRLRDIFLTGGYDSLPQDVEW
ncbi:MAG: hypothetical protein K6V97_00695 [Actinomycetia bacterium]|nr:hypothetical protein [Actinomycetes bacterium]